MCKYVQEIFYNVFLSLSAANQNSSPGKEVCSVSVQLPAYLQVVIPTNIMPAAKLVREKQLNVYFYREQHVEKDANICRYLGSSLMHRDISVLLLVLKWNM